MGVPDTPEYAVAESERHSNYLFEGLIEGGCVCYTNGDWDEYHDRKNGFGYHDMTESTFDAGVIITSETLHFCFWIEEED